MYKCHVCMWSCMISFLFFLEENFDILEPKSHRWSLSSHSNRIPNTGNEGVVSSQVMHAVPCSMNTTDSSNDRKNVFFSLFHLLGWCLVRY